MGLVPRAGTRPSEAHGGEDLLRGLRQLLHPRRERLGVQHARDDARAGLQVSPVHGLERRLLIALGRVRLLEGERAVHVEHGGVQEIPDVRRLRVEHQRGQVEPGRVVVLAELGMRDGEVRPTAGVVGLQLQALVVRHHGLARSVAARVRQRRPELVPARVVVRPQAARGRQRRDGGVVIEVDVLHHAQCYEYVRVEGVRLRSLVQQASDLLTPRLVLVVPGRL
mmetsp:Transcript_112657/g.319471  ORF Transcript_112657/g.319471 Transcript_112657/m.319471 type:complete len:224 (+) Transcript_112657:149-820(+)